MELNYTNVGLMITLASFVVAFLTYNLTKKKEDTKEIKEDTTAQTRLEMQLEYIKQGVDDIKGDMKEVKDDAKNTKEVLEKKISEQAEIIVRHDESLKSAHKRINELEERLNKERK